MVLVVILEPLVKLGHHGFCVRPIMNVDIIPFEGLHESFGHAVGLGASNGSKTTDEAHVFGKRNGFRSGVATAVIAEPFCNLPIFSCVQK